MRLLLLFFCLNSAALFSQIGQYKDYNYSWPANKPEPITVAESFKSYDAVLLQEDNFITVDGGEKAENLNVFFQKKARLKFLSKDAIEKYSTIILPATTDPLAEQKAGYFNFKVIFFAARIIKPDGRIVDAIIEEKLITEKVLFDELYFYTEFFLPINLESQIQSDKTLKFLNVFTASFRIKNLDVGDELEFDYKYEVPYRDNWFKFNSSRIFFHGELPKQAYTLTFKNRTNINIMWSFPNGAEPQRKEHNEAYSTYFWSRENLTTEIKEVGARPYKSLPHCIYTIKTNFSELRDINLHNWEEKIVPYWRLVAILRERYDPQTRRDIRVGVKNSQTASLEKFIRESNANIPDSLPFQKLANIHKVIVNDFSYSDDKLLYELDDIRKERMGEFVTKKVLRDVSRYKLYSYLLNSLNLNYFTAYHVDSRVGEISEAYYTPLYNNPYSLVIPYKKNLVYLYPKQSRSGLYMDEMPFYWENSDVIYFTYNDIWNEIPLKPRFIKTPASTANDNYRRSTALVEVNLDSLLLIFNSKVLLSGQYSTLTRGSYLYNYCDPTINLNYSKKIWETGGKLETSKHEFASIDNSYPYRTDLRTKYKVSGLVKKTGAVTFQLDIKNWFNHITCSDIDTNLRKLDFYTDFLGQDVYTYFIKFNKNVELTEGEKQYELENEMGKIKIVFIQIDPNTIKAESYFAINKEKVSAGKIQDVTNMYSAIENLNNHVIQILVKD